MRKRYLVIVVILAFTLSASVRSDETIGVTRITIVPIAGAPREQDSKEQASKKQTDIDLEKKNVSDTSEGVFAGIIDMNKGFMIAIISDEDSESYAFGLDEKQNETYKDTRPGDMVSVTHTNGLPSPDNMDMAVVDIEAE